MWRALLIVALLLALPSCVCAATCTGACVQATTITTVTGSGTYTGTFGVSTTTGNTVIVSQSNSNGGLACASTGSFTGQGTWSLIADSGGGGASAARACIYCAVVSSPGTTLTFTNQGNTSFVKSTEYSQPKTCTVLSSAVANATSGTSVTPSSLNVLGSSSLTVAVGVHKTSEAVTDNTTGMTKSDTNATTPTLTVDYLGGAGSPAPSYSWSTTSGNAAAVVALGSACSNQDDCVQAAPYHSASGGANNTVTFPNNVAPGDLVIATINLTTGNSSAAMAPATGSDLAATWTQVEDTGNAGASGKRIIAFCGTVNGAGTTAVFQSITGGSYATAKEIKGHICTLDGTASVYNSSTLTVSSVTPTALTTTNANDFILANVLFNGGGGVITDNSTGFTPAGIGTAGPTVTSDYQSVSSTGTYGASWSIGSAAIAAGGQFALEAGSVYGQMQIPALQPFALATPVVYPTPSLPNLGIFESFNQRFLPSPYSLPAHMQGVQITVAWPQVEPRNGVFTWTPITSVESQLSSGQYLQVMIASGQQSPTSTGAGATWLKDAGVGGVNALWANATPPPNKGLVECVTPTFEPDPGDATYVAAVKGLVAAFETQFSGDPKIALITISPSSDVSYDVALSHGTQKCSNNPNYTAEWNAYAATLGITTETQWRNHVLAGMESITDYEAAIMHDQNQAQWIQTSANFATIDGSNDTLIVSTLFNYMSANDIPANAKLYIAQESLNCTGQGAFNLMAPYAFNYDGMGAQMAGPFTNGACTGSECGDVCQAAITNGSNLGILWQQIYNKTVTACPSEMAKIAAAIQGTPETCP